MSHGVLFAYEVAYEVQNKCVKNLSFDFKTSVRKLTTKKNPSARKRRFCSIVDLSSNYVSSDKKLVLISCFYCSETRTSAVDWHSFQFSRFYRIQWILSNGYYLSSPAALIKFSIGTGIGHHETIRVKSSNGSEVRVERE